MIVCRVRLCASFGVATHGAAVVGGAVKGSHDILCVFLRHLDEAVVRHEVDVSYILTLPLTVAAAAGDMAVDKLHDLSGIEAFSLSEVYEEACISL